MRIRNRTVVCIFLVGLFDATLYGMSFPVFSVRFDHHGLDPSLIGLSTTLGALAALLCGPRFPRLLRRLGYRAFTAAAFGLALAAVLGLVVSDSVAAWFASRLVLSVALAAMWVSTDAWLGDIAPDRVRGRLTGASQAIYSVGFLVGPSITYLTGYLGAAPVLTMAALCAAALCTLCFTADPARIGAEPDDTMASWRDLRRVRGGLMVLLVGALTGLCETAVYTLLPVYGIHQGMTTGAAVGLLVAYALGEAVLALPMGVLADRITPEHALLAGAAVSAACFVLLAVVVNHRSSANAAAFVAGGLVYSLYNNAVVLIGARFARAALPTAMTAFTMSYSLGSVAGSSMGGGVMDMFGPAALPIFLGVALGCSALALLIRKIVRQPIRRVRRS
jgi:MFS family permease